MPFTKIGSDRYRSPSGRFFTGRQVWMYYATEGPNKVRRNAMRRRLILTEKQKKARRAKKYYVGTYRDNTMKKACIFVTTARDCIPASAITVYSVTANSQKEAVAWYKNLLKRAGYDS
jgi:hypothetical protein